MNSENLPILLCKSPWCTCSVLSAFFCHQCLSGLVHSWLLASSISGIAEFQIPSSQRNQVQGVDDSEGIKAIKAVASRVLQCWMEIRCNGRYQSAMTDLLRLVSAVVTGDPAALQAVRWDSGVASLKTKVMVQIWEIPDITLGERNGTSGYWCLSWDLNTLIFTLKADFSPHIFSVLLGTRNYLWVASCCPLSCSCLFCLLLTFTFLFPLSNEAALQHQCGSGGNWCFPGCPWHAISTWGLSDPLLLSLVLLGTFLAMSSGWQGRYHSWDVMD